MVGKTFESLLKKLPYFDALTLPWSNELGKYEEILFLQNFLL